MLSFMLALGLATTTADINKELQSFADSYQTDALREDINFGIKVDGKEWTVESKHGSVRLLEGAPASPTFVYVLDHDTLQRVASGQFSGLTAMGKARAGDPSPMQLESMDGFKPGDDFKAQFLSVTSHFWAKGDPEILKFGFDHARTVHGGEAVPVFYAPGIRTAWYGLLPGQHINQSPQDQKNDFDSVFMVIKGGTARMKIGGKELPLESGSSIHVRTGVTHEFWNPGTEPAELVMIAFGEGA